MASFFGEAADILLDSPVFFTRLGARLSLESSDSKQLSVKRTTWPSAVSSLAEHSFWLVLVPAAVWFGEEGKGIEDVTGNHGIGDLQQDERQN